MKSKNLTKTLMILVSLSVLIIWVKMGTSNGPYSGVLEKEWLNEKFPESVDTDASNWLVLPYGYTLGPWPKLFNHEPILTEIDYHRGPPKKFIQSIRQLWIPVEVELTLLGPKTLIEGKSQTQWKDCFESRFSCRSDRKIVLDYLARKNQEATLMYAKWFDHLDSNGPRGIHLAWDFKRYQVDDFVLITENGIAQGFKLKTVKSEVGEEARNLFYQILGNLKVKEDLSSNREWIQNRIRSVQLNQIQKMSSQKEKLIKLIETQNFLTALLSVDPTQVTPFFHFAGVTHLLSLELIRLHTQYFQNQESWILGQKPNLENALRFSKDFDQEMISKQIEDLLQDFLLQKQRASSR